jgi:hypothetical protein
MIVARSRQIKLARGAERVIHQDFISHSPAVHRIG